MAPFEKLNQARVMTVVRVAATATLICAVSGGTLRALAVEPALKAVSATQSTKSLPVPNNKPAAHKRLTLRELTEQVGSTHIEVRLNALKELAKMGPAAAPAVSAIINALNDNRSCEFGSLSKRVSPIVTDEVLFTLKAIGPGARASSPYLVTMLKDRNELFRRDKILDALASTGLDDSATKTIIYVAQSEGKATKTRVTAIRVLGLIDPPAAEAADVLREFIDDKGDPASREEALKSITSITQRIADRDAAAANGGSTSQNQEISDLRNALDIKNSTEERVEAVQKIGSLGNKGAILVPYLIQIINDPNTSHKLSLESMKVCGYIGPEASAALPALISKLMSEKDELDRGAICRAITSLDPIGKRAIPLIIPALEDPFRARISIELLDALGTGESTNLAQKARAHWRIK